jgi:hypothetical protein
MWYMFPEDGQFFFNYNNLWAWMVRCHTKSYIHTQAVKNVIKNSVSWTTKSSFGKMLVVLFLDITHVVNSFVALAFDGGVWCQLMLWLLYLWGRKQTLVPICQEAGWVSKLIWMWWWQITAHIRNQTLLPVYTQTELLHLCILC